MAVTEERKVDAKIIRAGLPLSDEYYIVAQPNLLSVTPGAVVKYTCHYRHPTEKENTNYPQVWRSADDPRGSLRDSFGWARTNYVYRTQFGVSRWRVPDDSWDFDLRPWLDRGQIRWCPPGSDNAAFSTEPPEQCPYVNLPGERRQMVVRGNTSWAAGQLDGCTANRAQFQV